MKGKSLIFFFFSSPDRYFEISECILETLVLDYSEFVLKRAKT